MGIIQTVRAQLEKQADRAARGLLNRALPPSLPGPVAEPLKRAISAAISGDVNGEAAQSRVAMASAARVASNLAAQHAGLEPLAAVRELGRSLGGAASLRDSGPIATLVGAAPGAQQLGGLSRDMALRLFAESSGVGRALKSLWHVEISELTPSREAPRGISRKFNLLAIDCTFDSFTLTGDSVSVGAGHVDNLTGAERVQMTITTYDDEAGSVKRWAEAKADQAARHDGTFGVPADYLMRIYVTQSDPLGQSDPTQRPVHRHLMRVESVAVDLSRRQHELEEVQIRFVEFDSFIKP